MSYEHDQDDIWPHMPFLEECASKAGIIIEIGVGHGNGSTRAFARGLERSTAEFKLHVGVDIDPERPQLKPRYPYWREIHGPSEDKTTVAQVAGILWQASRLSDDADIIFIDTAHTYEQMKKELPLWEPFTGPITLWIFHDTWMNGEYNHMTDAIKEFAAAHGWEYEDYSKESHGLGLMRRKCS